DRDASAFSFCLPFFNAPSYFFATQTILESRAESYIKYQQSSGSGLGYFLGTAVPSNQKVCPWGFAACPLHESRGIRVYAVTDMMRSVKFRTRLVNPTLS
ncbi:MAG: hypothetical protein WAV34_08075, partial [Lactococcus raffinolactis]